MDAFQVVAGALGAAELAFKLYETLTQFVSRVRDAGEEALELRDTVQRSRRILKAAREILQARETDPDRGTPAMEERQIWSNIHESLISWDLNIERFKERMKNISSASQGRTSLNWVEKTMLQLKIDRKAPTIQRFQKKLGEHMQELGFSLQCLNM